MTDDRDDHELDELASAHLDGLTSPAEAARVAADPALAARVEALRSVRDALRALDPPADPARRETAITAALAAFDEPAAGSVTPLTAVARRRGRDARSVRRLAIAAAVALVALAVPLMASLDSGEHDDESTALATGDEGSEAAPEAASDGIAVTSTIVSDAGALAAPTDLGSYADLDALSRALDERMERTAGDGGDPNVPVASSRDLDTYSSVCPEDPPVPADATIVLSGTATVGGRAVWAIVYELADGDQRLLVVDQTDCTVTSTPL